MEGIQSLSYQLEHQTNPRSLGGGDSSTQQQQQMIRKKNALTVRSTTTTRTTTTTRILRTFTCTGINSNTTKNNTKMIVVLVSYCLLLMVLPRSIIVNMNNNNDQYFVLSSVMALETNVESIVAPVVTVQEEPSSSLSSSQQKDDDDEEGEKVQVLEPWYIDFYTLPHDVPWPGIKWYDRMYAATATAAAAAAVETSPSKTMTMLSSTNNGTQQQILPTSNDFHNNSTNQYVFVWDGIEYSSIYALFVYNDPMKYACRNFNSYVNSIFISRTMMEYILHTTQSVEITHYILCYIRNFIGAMIIYYGTAAIFHYFCYIYPPIAKETFQLQDRHPNNNNNNKKSTKRPLPTTSTILHQITLAQCSLFLYVLLPVVDEYVVEQNMTQVYFTLSQVNGIYMYVLYLLLYFALVEVGIYWMHRTLHTNKVLYKYIHMKHHQYNKIETLTPWASIAFHPLDGILQASPYFLVIFIVPCHYMTHVALLFFTAIWATYIHDAMDFNFYNHAIIMGSKYHTIHHTHYIYNYGQVFTFCDRLWGTLRIPTAPTGTTATSNTNTTTQSKKQSSVKME